MADPRPVFVTSLLAPDPRAVAATLLAGSIKVLDRHFSGSRSGQNVIYTDMSGYAWWTACPEVIALDVSTQLGRALVRVELDMAGLAICVIEPGSGPVAGYVGQEAKNVHQFPFRLPAGNYRAYAVAGDELLLDQESPIGIYSCSLEVLDISNLVLMPQIRFEVLLSEAARLAAVLIPKAPGARRATAAWLSPGQALMHEVVLPPVGAGDWRIVLFAAGEFAPA